MLDNRSFGGAQVSRTFYARGQTGQQLLLGAYQALERQVAAGQVKMFPAPRDAGLVVVDGHARGIVTRDLITGQSRVPLWPMPWSWPPAVMATSSISRPMPKAATSPPSGGPTRAVRSFAQPLLHADSPDLHSGHRRVPIQADADERVAAQRRAHLGARQEGRQAAAEPDSGSGARLLPGTQISQLRQPGAARRGLPQRQGGVR